MSQFNHTPRRSLLALSLTVLSAAGTLHAADKPAKEISYNRDIQPILSESCFFCHGPDSSSRKPKSNPLRLDIGEFALAPRGKDGTGDPVIIPGKPEKSELVYLLESDDPDEVMPLHPSRDAAHGKIMPKRDIELIKEWIRQGAKYEPHWAYVAPKKPALPEVKNKAWIKAEIDHFTLAQQEKLNLKANPQQAKHRLLRRLNFDLTGLPPTAQELQAFLDDPRDFDTVYTEKVDQLLTTTAHAEHLTRHWLDVARYADTQGIHHDHHRTSWPYRDWLINAFKSNMPFDQFSTEQLAGDLLPNATVDQKVATGYLRALATSGEGGAIPAELEAIYAQDRVDTMAATWLGLTTGCASCHDHKFDQLSTKEVYQFTAFFRNNTTRPLEMADGNNGPVQFVPHQNDRATYPAVQQKVAAAQQQFNAMRATQKPAYEAWKTSLTQAPLPAPQSEIIINAPEKKITLISAGQSEDLPTADLPLIPTSNPQLGLTFNGKQNLNFPAQAINLSADKPFTLSFQVYVEDDQQNGALFGKMGPGPAHKGWDVWLEGGRIGMHLINNWPKNGLKIIANNTLPVKRWSTITITYDGSRRAQGFKIYFDNEGKPRPHNGGKKKFTGDFTSPLPFALGSRSNGQAPVKNISLANLRHYDSVISAFDQYSLVLQNDPNHAPNKTIPPNLENHYYANVDPQSKPLHDKLKLTQKEEQKFKNRGATTLVYEEKKGSEPHAHILIRGQYASKGEKVFPNTPAILPPLIKNSPAQPHTQPLKTENSKLKTSNRLDLAKWLTRDDQPLTARVTVNRYWSYFFGQGLLSNNADFGAMGGSPSHPGLIDWLSRDFMDSGWNLRHMLKNIVTSATYRQSAIATDENRKADPDNKLLTRGPRYRLDAEQLRDQALSVSRLLSPKVGGPSVKPYQPDGHWLISMPSSNTKFYKQSEGEDLYRRSLYTYWKRQALHPVMDIFNATIRETTCVQRERTNTPLQALVTLNEPLFVESARLLATRALWDQRVDGDTYDDFDRYLDHITSNLIARTLTDPERAVAKDSYTKILGHYQKTPEAAKALITVGDRPANGDIPPEKLATWTLIASQILNLDEALTK